MTPTDWTLLCTNIYQKNCVLFIGSYFPVNITNGNVKDQSTFSDYLVKNICAANKINNPAHTELSSLANHCVTNLNKREEFSLSIQQYLQDGLSTMESPAFQKLMELPFTFIVDTNYSDFFCKQAALVQAGTRMQKYPKSDFYNFQGKKKDLAFEQNRFLDNIAEPCFYNLFGSYADFNSIALTEHDLIELLIRIISKDPDLPSTITSKLSSPDVCFLFIGFGVLSKNWYFRMLLYILKCRQKSKNSYIMEYLNIDNDESGTVYYFENGLNTKMYSYESEKFIDDLVDKYRQYVSKQPPRDDGPAAFISYKSEDINYIKELEERLKFNGIKVIRDKVDMKNESWKQQLSKFINESNAFILAQSAGMKKAVIEGETYICTEIVTAINRASDPNAFTRQADFLYPIYIDNSDSCITKYPDLADIHSSDLRPADDFNQRIDKLAREIKMTHEKNRNRK